MAAAAASADAGGGVIGGRVGYAIPFEAVVSPSTAIIFYAADTLLRSALADPLFTGCGAVVVALGGPGEARPLTTDALLGLLARVLPRRPDLRVVLTADDPSVAAAAARYFGWRPGQAVAVGHAHSPTPTAALLAVTGGECAHPFSPSLQYAASPVPDFVSASVDAVATLHASDRPGDILVILPRPSDVDAVADALAEARREEEERGVSGRKRGRGTKPGPSLAVARLHGGVPKSELALALAPAAPPGAARRAILTVGSAVDGGRLAWAGVTAVVDALLAWQAGWDPPSGLDASGVGPVSQATADLRAGLAVGRRRDRPGLCVRLATEASFAGLDPTPPPGVRRADLAPTLLLLAALSVGDALAFPWPSRPPSSSAARGLETLHALGALCEDGKGLTPTGQAMAELPCADPRLARALVSAGSGGDPAVTDSLAAAVAMASVRGVWSRAAAGGSASGLAAAKARFAAAEGDWVTHLNVWRAWHEAGGGGPGGPGGRGGRASSSSRAAWAGANGVDHRAMLRAADVAGQIRSHAQRLGLAVSEGGRAGLARPAGGARAGAAAVVAALAAGLAVNAAVLTDATGAPGGAAAYRLVRPPDEGSCRPPPLLRMHRSSVLAGSAPPLVLFLGAAPDREGWHGMTDVCVVGREVLVKAAPHYFQG